MGQPRDSQGRFVVSLDLDATRLKQGAAEAKGAIGGVDASLKKVIGSAGAAGRATLRGLGDSTAAAHGLDLGIQKVAASLLGLGAAMRAGSSILTILDAGREKALDMARDVTKMRDSLRDIAAIAGVKGGANDQFLREVAGFRVATGLRGDEAHAFQEQFRGAGELSKGVTIAPDQYERYMTLLGRFTVAKGGEAGVMADLGGSALRFRKYDTAEDALGDIGSAYDILSRGKGQNPVLNRQLAKLSAAYVNEDQAKGAFKNLDEAAIATSVAAEFDPSASAELAMQALRALRAVNGGKGHEVAADSLRELGITGKDRFFEALPKLFGKLDKDVAGGMGVDEALSGMGFHSDEEKRALAVFYNNRGLIKNQQEFAASNHSAASTMAGVDVSFARDLSIRDRVADAAIDSARLDVGAEVERINILRKEAEARLLKRGEIDNGATDLIDWTRGLAGFNFSGPTAAGRAMRIDEEIVRMLRGRGIDVRIPGEQAGPSEPMAFGPSSLPSGYRLSGEFDRNISAADYGARLGGATLRETNDLLRQQLNATRSQQQRPLPAEPRNGAPASAR